MWQGAWESPAAHRMDIDEHGNIVGLSRGVGWRYEWRPLSGPPFIMSVPVSRILFSSSIDYGRVSPWRNSNLFDEAEEATIHLGPALPRDLGAAYLGPDVAEARVEAGNP